MNKYLLFLVGIILSLTFVSCGGDDKDDEPDFVNWNNVNLNNLESYYGYTFIAEEVIDENGTDRYSPSQYISFVINRDNTISVTHDVFTHTVPFTFSNGKFTYKYGVTPDIAEDKKDTYTLTFSHLNEYRLKMKYEDKSWSTGTVWDIIYRIYPQEPY